MWIADKKEAPPDISEGDTRYETKFISYASYRQPKNNMTFSLSLFPGLPQHHYRFFFLPLFSIMRTFSHANPRAHIPFLSVSFHSNLSKRVPRKKHPRYPLYIR